MGLIVHDEEKLMYIPNRLKMWAVITYCYIDFFFWISKCQHMVVKWIVALLNWLDDRTSHRHLHMFNSDFIHFRHDFLPPPPPNQEVILLPGGESLELLVLKGKYCKTHCVCCKWNSDHACNHCTLLSNSQQPSSSFDQGELKCVCLSCFTWCLLQHLGEHKMPRPLVGVCHKCFWWDSHLWWVRFYTCWTPLYVCLRPHPCQGGKTKGNWTQVSIMCFCFLRFNIKVLSSFKCFN